MDEVPRGFRNNNPGNIKISNESWIGKVTPNTDGTFEQFDTPQHGIRAIAVILRNYHKIYGLSTLRQFIARWAPPDENDTGSYLESVCRSVSANPDDPYDVLDPVRLADLVAAIIHQECGSIPYDEATLTAGADMALA